MGSLYNLNKQRETLVTLIDWLNNLGQTIEQHGISAPMMMAADPYCELVDNKICPSYETLQDVCVKDNVSEAVVEGITDKIKTLLVKQIIYIKDLDKKIQQLGISEYRDSYLDRINGSISIYKLKSNEFNETYFKHFVCARSYDKPEFKLQVKAVSKLMYLIDKLKYLQIGNDLINITNTISPDMTKVDEIVKDIVSFYTSNEKLLNESFGVCGSSVLETPARKSDVALIHHDDIYEPKQINVGDTWNFQSVVEAANDLKQINNYLPRLNKHTKQLQDFDKNVNAVLIRRKADYPKYSRQDATDHARVYNLIFDIIHNQYILIKIAYELIEYLFRGVFELTFKMNRSRNKF